MHVCIIICAKIDHLIALTFKVSVKLRSLITSSWAWPIIMLSDLSIETLNGSHLFKILYQKHNRKAQHYLCNIDVIE